MKTSHYWLPGAILLASSASFADDVEKQTWDAMWSEALSSGLCNDVALDSVCSEQWYHACVAVEPIELLSKMYTAESWVKACERFIPECIDHNDFTACNPEGPSI